MRRGRRRRERRRQRQITGAASDETTPPQHKKRPQSHRLVRPRACMCMCASEAGQRARNLPDKWGDPRISSVLEHDEKVRHENSNCISKLSNPPFDRQEEVVRPWRGFCSRFAPAKLQMSTLMYVKDRHKSQLSYRGQGTWARVCKTCEWFEQRPRTVKPSAASPGPCWAPVKSRSAPLLPRRVSWRMPLKVPLFSGSLTVLATQRRALEQGRSLE